MHSRSTRPIRIRCLVLIAGALLTAVAHSFGQSKPHTAGIVVSTKHEIMNTEPGRYDLGQLFASADKVALVQVSSGTTDAYDVAIYKGRVIKAFKGTQDGDIVYFGPYIGTKLGSEYLLFLKDQTNILVPKDKEAGYGPIKYSRVFNEGYSSMLISYECGFNGSDSNQQCDYAVRVCTDYIHIPDSLQSSPSRDTVTPFGCRWVRKDRFVSAFETITGRIE